MSEPVLWQTLTWEDVAALRDSGITMAILPVGATEQHGPHLPLRTDTDIAVALYRRLGAARTDVLIAPPLAYGSSGEHADFAGTLSIGGAALESLLVELGRSADAFAGLVFVSAHGGNAGALRAAVSLLRSESRRVRAWFLPADTAPRADAHAGYTETSVMLALSPSAVRIGSAEAGATDPLGAIMPVLAAAGVASVSPNGVLGDPSGASASEGRRVIDDWASKLLDDLDGWP